MFDLVSILKSGKDADADNEHIKTVFFYQTEKCKSLIEETFRFEGFSEPVAIENKQEKLTEYIRSKPAEIIIIELLKVEDIVVAAQRISNLLPSGSTAVIIGAQDTISIQRQLKQLGFYYLLWPVTKGELTEFVRDIHEQRDRRSGVGGRKAKRVSIIGAKGGVGATMIAAELSCVLSEVKHSSCVLVDYNYNEGNLDVMLGLSKFERKKAQQGIVSESLDASSAKSFMYKKSPKLQLLSVAADELDFNEMIQYKRSIANAISSECNFILEDLSASTGLVFNQSNHWLESNCIIIVTNSTVSSLRDAGRLYGMVNSIAASERPRVFIVVNHNMPEKYASVKPDEIEKFFKRKVDLTIPYIKDFADVILDGKRLSDRRNKASALLNNLASLVLGEQINKKSFLFKRSPKG